MFSKPISALSLAVIAVGCNLKPEPTYLYGTVFQDHFSIEKRVVWNVPQYPQEVDSEHYWFEVEIGKDLYTLSVKPDIRGKHPFPLPQDFYNQIYDQYNNLKETIQAGTKVRVRTYESEKREQTLYVDDITVLEK